MKTNLNDTKESGPMNEVVTASSKRQRTVTMALAGFTFLGLLWIVLLSDTFSQAARVEPKNYAEEEIRNLEMAKMNDDGLSYDKLKDENAVQYVNDAVEEDAEVEETDEAPEPVKEEVEEDPVGEEF